MILKDTFEFWQSLMDWYLMLEEVIVNMNMNW